MVRKGSRVQIPEEAPPTRSQHAGTRSTLWVSRLANRTFHESWLIGDVPVTRIGVRDFRFKSRRRLELRRGANPGLSSSEGVQVSSRSLRSRCFLPGNWGSRPLGGIPEVGVSRLQVQIPEEARSDVKVARDPHVRVWTYGRVADVAHRSRTYGYSPHIIPSVGQKVRHTTVIAVDHTAA